MSSKISFVNFHFLRKYSITSRYEIYLHVAGKSSLSTIFVVVVVTLY